MQWVFKTVSLNQTSENVCSPGVSATSVLVSSLGGFCWYGTTANVLRLIHQVIYYTDIGKSLITYTQVYFTFKFYFYPVTNCQTSENAFDLVQAALATETDVFCLAYAHVCSIQCFLSAVGSRQLSCGANVYRFPSWTDGKRYKSLISPKFILFLFYLLLLLSVNESLCVHL